MPIDVPTFTTRFPEFSDIAKFPVAVVQLHIDDALEDVSQTKFKQSIADRITAYLAAHYLALATVTTSGNSGSVAPVASQSVGEVSVSYAVNNVEKGSGAYFNATSYGQQYLTLLRRYCPSIVSLNG